MNHQVEDQPRARSRNEKVQMTVRLQPAVVSAAKKASARNGTPVSVIIAEAAGYALLPQSEESIETKLDKMSNRLLSRMETLERALGRELLLTRELVAQFARAYFNHTPAIPEQERAAASLSGRLRFVRLVEHVNVNAGQGVSILDDTEVPNG